MTRDYWPLPPANHYEQPQATADEASKRTGVSPRQVTGNLDITGIAIIIWTRLQTAGLKALTIKQELTESKKLRKCTSSRKAPPNTHVKRYTLCSRSSLVMPCKPWKNWEEQLPAEFKNWNTHSCQDWSPQPANSDVKNSDTKSCMTLYKVIYWDLLIMACIGYWTYSKTA